MTDWKKDIAIACHVKSEMEKLDVHRLWEYHLPRVAASENDLVVAEAAIGHSLDPRYRDFLSFANGWECFYHDVTLFGTGDLIGGKMMALANVMLGEIVPEAYKEGPLGKSEWLPIAVSARDKDMFVMTRPTGQRPAGIVIWLAGQEIDRFASFDEFFLAMVDYNRLEYRDFLEGR